MKRKTNETGSKNRFTWCDIVALRYLKGSKLRVGLRVSSVVTGVWLTLFLLASIVNSIDVIR